MVEVKSSTAGGESCSSERRDLLSEESETRVKSTSVESTVNSKANSLHSRSEGF